MTEPPLTPEVLLRGYAAGIFPMAESRGRREVFWVDPKRRGILPLQEFHISRSLRRRLRHWPCTIRTDTDFDGVVAACADRGETWISPPIRAAYLALHRAGFAHALEVWEGAALVGGVYGVALGAAFFGESMFSRRTDASKVALAYLVDRLRQGGFRLFDVQFLTPHLASLGAVEISRAEYHRRLGEALAAEGDWEAAGPPPAPETLLSRMASASGTGAHLPG
jgi:leucyl/phenylalanyl-tRNA--protein transferase